MSATPAARASNPEQRLIAAVRLIAWSAMTLIAAWVVFAVGPGPAGIYGVYPQIAMQILTLVVVAVALGTGTVTLERLQASLVAPALLACWTALTLAAVLSPWPRFGLQTVISATGAVGLYLFLVELLRSPWWRPRLRLTVGMLVVVLAVAYLVQLIPLWADWYSASAVVGIPPLRPAMAGLSLGSPNIVAALLLTLGPLLLAWTVGTPSAGSRPQIRTGFLIAAGLLAFDIYATGSRGAWLGAVVAGVVGGVIVGGDRLRDIARFRRQLVAVIAGLALIGGPLFAFGFERIVRPGTEARLSFWRDSLAMFASSPLTGLGPATWPFAHWVARPEFELVFRQPHAHNFLVQAAAELGLVGLAVSAVVAIVIVRLVHSALKVLPRTEVAGVAAGLSGLAAQSMVDNFSNLPAIILAVSFLVAWLDSAAREPRSGSRLPALLRARWVPAGIVAIGLATAATTLLPWDIAGMRYVGGIQSAVVGDWKAADSSFAAAQAADPGMPVYGAARAVALAHEGRVAVAATIMSGAADLTDDPFLWVQAAVLAEEGGLPAEKVDGALGRALAKAPADLAVVLNAGWIAEHRGHMDAAIHRYATALALEPRLAESTFWTVPSRAPWRAQLLEKATDFIGPTDRANVWLYASDFGRARSELNALPPTPGVQARIALVDLLSDGSSDLAPLQVLAREHPRDLLVVGSLYEAALAVRATETERYQRWLELLDPFEAIAARPRVIVGGDSPETASLLFISQPWAGAVYARDELPAPGVLAPQVLYVGFR